MKTLRWSLDGEVHVHCLELPQEASELLRFRRILSSNEGDRAALLQSEAARNSYIAGRGVLRDILSCYLEIEPAGLWIETGEHGKPLLGNCKENLQFNLSHSGNQMLLAVAAGREVGIDIEKIEENKPLKDIAQLVFSRSEQEELFSLPSPLQTEAFYHCWTRKEACMKACGRGFSLCSNSFNVSLFSLEGAVQTVSCNQKNWHVLKIGVTRQYCAALAVEAHYSSPYSPAVTVIDHRKKAPRV